MPISRRVTLTLAASICAAMAANPAAAQQASSQPIKMIVPFPPGGFADGVARIVAERLEGKLKQTVVVENRAGASGNLGARLVVNSAPDGQTILVTTTAAAINPTLYKNLGYAPGDLKAVAIVGSAPESIVVHPSNPANNLKDFVEQAKKQSLNYGTPGVGTGSYIATTYLFKALAKVELTHVPFQGGAPAMNAVMGNHVGAIALTVSPLVPHILSGKVKALGIAAAKRSAALPNVPTYSEGGFDGFLAASWVGLFVPAKTADARIDRLNGAVNDILKEPEVLQRLARFGLEPMGGSTKTTADFYQREIANWGKMVTTLGMKIE